MPGAPEREMGTAAAGAWAYSRLICAGMELTDDPPWLRCRLPVPWELGESQEQIRCRFFRPPMARLPRVCRWAGGTTGPGRRGRGSEDEEPYRGRVRPCRRAQSGRIRRFLRWAMAGEPPAT